jgi:hypothetical protein
MDQNRVAPAIKEVKGAPEDAIGWAVSDGVGDKIRNYASGLSAAVRDAEAMKSAGLLVASPIKTGP